MISVALCTYNGERYLPAQLESIARQSLPPDEVVVCDDVSTDGTIALLEQFAARVPFPVRLVQNERNLRSTANFAKAISLCRGEYIALCDQDDLWRPDKLAALRERLNETPEAGMVFSDANLVDEAMAPLDATAWQSVQLHGRKRRLIEGGDAYLVFLSQYVVTGATLMFRASYRPLILPIPSEWVHDAWIAFLLAAVAPVRMVERPLIDYRQHSNQQIGLPHPRRPLVELLRAARRLKSVSYAGIQYQFRQAYDRLCDVPESDPRLLAGLERKLAHLGRRDNLRRKYLGRFPMIARDALSGDYWRYSYGLKSVVQDLFF